MRASFSILAAVAACAGGERAATSPRAAAAGQPMWIAALDVWPDRWPRVAAALDSLPDGSAFAHTQFWTLAKQLGDLAGLPGLSFPPPGLDATAPITIELYGARASFETTALAILRASQGGERLERIPSLRVRVTLPAIDAERLAGALSTAIAARDKTAEPQLRIAVDRSAVAVDIAVGGNALAEPDPPRLTLAFDSGGDSAARAMLRVDQLGELDPTIGVSGMVSLLENHRRDREELFAGSVGELLTAYLLADPAASFATAMMVDIPAEPTKRPQVSFALSEAGKTTLSAAGLARGHSAPLAELRWSDAIAAAPQSAFLATATQQSDKNFLRNIAWLFAECGPSCFLYVALGNGFQLARANGLHNAEALTSMLPLNANALRAFEVTWTTDDLAFVHEPGRGKPPAAWHRTDTRTITASETCYRKALFAVRAGLKDRSARSQAAAALADASRCVSADPAIAARHRAMTDLVRALK